MIRELRDLLLEHREDWAAAREAFAWPQLDEFNWALDFFDPLARGNEATGLLVIEVTPGSIRIRKRVLAESDRRRLKR